ncbi:MAG: peptidoglycan-binding protein, partial [Marinovum sp.]|nr:peptidoglycan-binding protein [Marinovum sp.]
AFGQTAEGYEAFWVQIESQPSLVEAQERVRDYAASLPDVAGFSIRGGWYGLALGPYSQAEATRLLSTLRAAGQIPRDSYLTRSGTYGQQFWPVGASVTRVLPQASTTAPAQVGTSQTSEQTLVQAAAEPEPDETVQQARRSEARLIRAEREDLQIALKWAGFYRAAIDGAFGRGTRRSMADWQAANGFEETGVLTTKQRAELLRQYNAVLEGMDLQLVSDSDMGIEMLVPRGVVAFEGYDAPFARFGATGSLQAQLIQISQTGNQRTLFGLYDILQTLEIIPVEGDRQRRSDGFSITGENARIVSQTEVTLRRGEIKGYILVWPAGDEERHSRVLDEIRKSYRRIDGVLPSGAGLPEEAPVDLISGLAIRKPIRGRSGAYIDTTGRVLTSTEAVAGCGSITLEGSYQANVEFLDDALGLAIVTPKERLSPPALATLAVGTARRNAEVAVAGYPFEGILGAPTLTFGAVTDTQGLGGEAFLDRLSLDALSGDTGGPILDNTGALVGVLLPKVDTGRVFPANVSFSADTDAIRDLLSRAGVTPVGAAAAPPKAPEDLTSEAAQFTVLVNCWN